jgi:hypothetical protein
MPRRLLACLIAGTALAFGAAHASEPQPAVPGEKLDSGLGSLPPYGQWHRHPELQRFVVPDADRVLGEKLDSGLGDLPAYSQWKDHPELSRFVVREARHAQGAKPGGRLGEIARASR